MKKIISYVLISFCFTVIGNFAIAKTNTATESAEAMDITIKGKAKDIVDIEKETPQVNIELENIASSSADMVDNLLEKGVEVPDKKDFSQFNFMESNQVAQPHLPDISEPPLVKFYPKLSNISVKRWELIITDEKGDNIQTLKGDGVPTRTIKWDGINKKGEIIKVGILYSYRFVAIDTHNNPYTIEGEAFTLDALKYKKGKKIILEIDNKILYAKDEAEFSQDANLILEKTIDILREFSHYPFMIKLYVNDENSSLSRNRRDIIKTFISERLLLLPEEVEVRVLKKDKRGNITAFIILR